MKNIKQICPRCGEKCTLHSSDDMDRNGYTYAVTSCCNALYRPRIKERTTKITKKIVLHIIQFVSFVGLVLLMEYVFKVKSTAIWAGVFSLYGLVYYLVYCLVLEKE